MARAQFQDIPDELKLVARRSRQNRDRFILGVNQSQRREPSKAQKRLLRRPAVVNSPMQGRGSLFRFLSPYWKNLTLTQKAYWTGAAPYSSLTNWQLFISDNSARIRNSVTFPGTPSEVWQVRTGKISIESPASEILLKQEHPQSYIVAQKIAGTPWKKEIVSVTEVFSLPLTIGLSYKSDLETSGGTQRARLYADVVISYQGIDYTRTLAVDFDPSTDWNEATATLSSARGIIRAYTLYLDIFGYTGTLLFDNIQATHGGTNWARDPRCDNISQTFAGAFALIPPFWQPVSLPLGSSFSSVFPPSTP